MLRKILMTSGVILVSSMAFADYQYGLNGGWGIFHSSGVAVELGVWCGFFR